MTATPHPAMAPLDSTGAFRLFSARVASYDEATGDGAVVLEGTDKRLTFIACFGARGSPALTPGELVTVELNQAGDIVNLIRPH